MKLDVGDERHPMYVQPWSLGSLGMVLFCGLVGNGGNEVVGEEGWGVIVRYVVVVPFDVDMDADFDVDVEVEIGTEVDLEMEMLFIDVGAGVSVNVNTFT